MLNFFRLQHSDQQTIAGLLVVSIVLLFWYTATAKREPLELRPYRFRIDLDTATHGELQTLPGIGPKLADNIILYRDRHAPIHDFDEILNVSGIGNKRHSVMKPYFTD